MARGEGGGEHSGERVSGPGRVHRIDGERGRVDRLPAGVTERSVGSEGGGDGQPEAARQPFGKASQGLVPAPRVGGHLDDLHLVHDENVEGGEDVLRDRERGGRVEQDPAPPPRRPLDEAPVLVERHLVLQQQDRLPVQPRVRDLGVGHPHVGSGRDRDGACAASLLHPDGRAPGGLVRRLPDPPEVDPLRPQPGKGGSGEGVRPDHSRHDHRRAGAPRCVRLVGPLASGGDHAAVPQHRFAPLGEALQAYRDVDVDRAEDDDHDNPKHLPAQDSVQARA